MYCKYVAAATITTSCPPQKSATKLVAVTYFPPHLKYVAALPLGI